MLNDITSFVIIAGFKLLNFMISYKMVVEEYSAIAQHYKLKETVGSGGFAKVKRAVHLPTGETVAIKIMDKVALGVSLIEFVVCSKILVFMT